MESALTILAAGPPPDTSREAPDLVRLEEETITSLLRADEEERQQGDDRRHLQTAEERANWPDLTKVRPAGAMGMELDHYYARGEEIAELLRDYRMALARQDARIVEPELNAWLRKNGRTTDPDMLWRTLAAMTVLKAHVKAYGLLSARQGGDDVPTPEVTTQPAAKPSSDKGPKLSEAFTAWKQGGGARGSKIPSLRTLDSAQHAVRRFTEWHGDLRLGDITKAKAREFWDALAQAPTHLKRSEQKLSLREIIKTPAEPGRAVHAATVNKALQLLGGIVSHAMAAGDVDNVPGFTNPFGKGMKLQIDKRREKPREPFTAAGLKAIFGTPIYTAGSRPLGGSGEAAFWLPIIALVTGARQTEIAQLRVMDLAQDDETGLWFFNIKMEGGGSVKTASSVRKVPLHPALIRIGLLRYRQHLVDGGAGEDSKLWPEIRADGEQQAGPWSKWFHRELRKLGINDRRKVFHSFRHTFKRNVRGVIDEEASHAISGHAGDDNEGSKYGKGFELAKLAAIVETIPTPPVLEGLEWRPGEVRKAPAPRRPRMPRPERPKLKRPPAPPQ